MKPMSKEQLDEQKKRDREKFLLPDGVYDFEVVAAENTTSKKGNDMIALELRVFKNDGGAIKVRDWLVDVDNWMCQHKIRCFAETTGLEEVTAEYAIGQSGKCFLSSEDSQAYGPQNVISDYYTGSEEDEERVKKTEIPKIVPKSVSYEDDELPF